MSRIDHVLLPLIFLLAGLFLSTLIFSLELILAKPRTGAKKHVNDYDQDREKSSKKLTAELSVNEME